MSNVEKWNPGVAPGISAARLNEPFHVVSAIYDAVDDEIDVIIGHGRAQNGNGVVDLNTSDTTIHITSPVVSTTYYIFYNSDGTFTYSTTIKPAINTIILSSVPAGNPLSTAIVPVDLRNLLQSPAFIKSIYDADGDTGYEVERTADIDTHFWKVSGTDEMDLTSSGLKLKNGPRINDFSGVEKVWITFDGTGIISITDDYNVSTIDDDGVGLYTINFDTNFANTFYCVSGMVVGATYLSIVSKTTSSISIQVRDASSVLVDASIICVRITGEQ